MLNEMNNDNNNMDDINTLCSIGSGGLCEMMRGESDLTKLGGGAKQYLHVFEKIGKLLNYKEETVVLFITGAGDIMQEIKSKMKNKLSMYCIGLNTKGVGELKKYQM